MKPKSGFVGAMLALCSVTSVDFVQRKSINADHVRLMDKCLTDEAKEIILDLAEVADQRMESSDCEKTDAFIQSGLADLTEEERILLSCIYGSQGREIEINEKGMTIYPSNKVLQQKLRLERKQKVA